MVVGRGFGGDRFGGFGVRGGVGWGWFEKGVDSLELAC